MLLISKCLPTNVVLLVSILYTFDAVCSKKYNVDIMKINRVTKRDEIQKDGEKNIEVITKKQYEEQIKNYGRYKLFYNSPYSNVNYSLEEPAMSCKDVLTKGIKFNTSEFKIWIRTIDGEVLQIRCVNNKNDTSLSNSLTSEKPTNQTTKEQELIAGSKKSLNETSTSNITTAESNTINSTSLYAFSLGNLTTLDTHNTTNVSSKIEKKSRIPTSKKHKSIIHRHDKTLHQKPEKSNIVNHNLGAKVPLYAIVNGWGKSKSATKSKAKESETRENHPKRESTVKIQKKINTHKRKSQAHPN